MKAVQVVHTRAGLAAEEHAFLVPVSVTKEDDKERVWRMPPEMRP